MIIPFGAYTTPKRLMGCGSVAQNAGTMLSSRGNAKAAPIPRSMARRGIAFFVTIIF
jgi:hypothetical protein